MAILRLGRIKLTTTTVGVFLVLSAAVASILAITETQLRQNYRAMDFQRQLMRQLLVNLERHRSNILARQSALLALLLNPSDDGLLQYRKYRDLTFDSSLHLAELAARLHDEDLLLGIHQSTELEQRWRTDFDDRVLALRTHGAMTPPPPGLLQQGETYASQWDGDLARLSELCAKKMQARVEALDAANRWHVILLISIVIMVVLVFGACLFGLGRAVLPTLRELGRLADDVADGKPITEPVVHGFAELSGLRRKVVGMVGKIRDREGELLATQADTVRTNQELFMVNEYAQFLQQVSNEQDICRALVRQVQRITSADQVGLYLAHREHPTFELAASWPRSETEGLALEPRLNADECSVVRRNQPLCIRDNQAHLSASCQRCSSGFRGELCVPLADGSQVIGALHLTTTAVADWSPDTVRLVTSLANFTAPSISNQRLLENMWERATRDGLTGLYNRRYLDESLAIAIEDARRQQLPLGLLVCDIDQFKQVNDQAGHDAGDRVLVRVAQILRETVRASDIVCRFGGEEFVILLPRSDAAGALVLAEKLRQKIRERVEWTARSGVPVPVTISIGVAVYPSDADDAAELVKSADLGMYRAKAAGGDRCEMGADHPEGGVVLRPKS